MPRIMRSTFSRRRLLLAGWGVGTLAVAGCTADRRTPAAPATPTGPDPLAAVLDARVALASAYAASIAAFPELTERLAPLRTQTVEQVRLLRLALAAPTNSGASSGGTAAPPAVDAPAALAALRADNAANGAAAAALCLSTSAARAPLLGSLAAAAACHDALLG